MIPGQFKAAGGPWETTREIKMQLRLDIEYYSAGRVK